MKMMRAMMLTLIVSMIVILVLNLVFVPRVKALYENINIQLEQVFEP